ncbi:MAG: ribose-phosphate diphosphokinase [Caulobacterales bacterium]
MTRASVILLAFREDEIAAKGLALALDIEWAVIETHCFPDGEVLPRLPCIAQTVVFYRSLDHPDEKLLGLLLAADAARQANSQARRVLIAPYLPYMRQDAIFRPGEPISQGVVSRLLTDAFERIITIDPHLHRTHDLSVAFPRAEWTVLSAQSLLASTMKAEGLAKDLLVLGPDQESAPLVERFATALACDWGVFGKTRLDDQTVRLTRPPELRVAGRTVLIVDDVCASGGTLVSLARELSGLRARHIEVVATHALIEPAALSRLAAAGVARLRSCDTCLHPTNAFSVRPPLADALRDEVGPCKRSS